MAPVRAVWGYSSFCPDQLIDEEEERTDKQASKSYNFHSPSSAISVSDDSKASSSHIRPVELDDFCECCLPLCRFLGVYFL